MKSPTKKVFLLAALCYLGACIARYIAKIPPPPLDFIPMTDGLDPWSVWDYLTLIQIMFGLGLTIAGLVLIGSGRIKPPKKKLLDL